MKRIRILAALLVVCMLITLVLPVGATDVDSTGGTMESVETMEPEETTEPEDTPESEEIEEPIVHEMPALMTSRKSGTMLPEKVAVTELLLLKKITGTPDYDADDEPGHDSGEENDIIRTFDMLTYQMRAAIQEPEDGTLRPEASREIRVKVVIPGIKKGQVVFLTDSMGWLHEPVVTETEDGLTLEGYALVDGTEDEVYWLDFSVSMKAYKMKQGDTFAPRFYAWLDGQDIPAAVTEGTGVTVSARTAVNTYIYFSDDMKKGDFSFGSSGESDIEQTQYGMMMGISMAAEIYSEHDDLKGVELPEGDITFDVKLTVYENTSGTSQDVTEDFTPLLWDYHQYRPGQEATGYLGRSMQKEIGGINRLPYGAYTAEHPDSCVYDSGELTIMQEGDVLHVTIKDYMFSDDILFPTYAQRSYGFSSKEGVFSGIFLQLLVPYEEASDETGSKLFTVQAEIENLAIEENQTQQALDTDDMADKNIQSSVGTVKLGAGFTHKDKIFYSDTSITYYSGELRSTKQGNTYAYPGEELYFRGVAGADGPLYRNIEKCNGVDYLLKLPDAIELPDDLTDVRVYAIPYGGSSDIWNEQDNSYTINLLPNPFTWKAMYAVKPDGSGWTSEEEMDDAQVEELVYYETKEEAEEKGRIVGILIEGRGGETYVNTPFNFWFHVPVRVSDSAEVNYVFPANHEVRYYYTDIPGGLVQGQGMAHLGKESVELQDRIMDSIYKYYVLDNDYLTKFKNGSLISMGATYKKTYLTVVRQAGFKFVKSEYRDGQVVAGTHLALRDGKEIPAELGGASLLIVGQQATIEKRVEQLGEDGKARTVFDLSLGQRKVDFQLSPAYRFAGNYELEGKTDTLTITDTLDKGLTYVTGSTRQGGIYDPETESLTGGMALEPVVSTDDNGCQVLTWTLENVEANEEIAPIHYSCTIGTPEDESTDVQNGARLSSTVTITAPSDGRVVKEDNSNLATASIAVVRNGGASLKKTVDKQYSEKNDTLTYTLTLTNSGDTQYTDILLRDILPFDGDSRGTDLKGGSYTLTNVKVTGGSSDTLYITGDASVRSEDLNGTDLNRWTALPLENGSAALTDENSNAVAIAYQTDVPANQKVTVELQLKLELPTDGAVLGNRAEAGHDGNRLTSFLTETKTVTRKVSGLAWLDKNKDGQRNNGEKLLSGITVKLTDKSGNPVTDIYGNPVSDLITGTDGSYCFTNLSAGEYQVWFSGEMLTDYVMTTQNTEGVSDDRDSDAEGIYTSGKLQYALITNVTLPTLAEIMEEGIDSRSANDLDAGFAEVKEEEPPEENTEEPPQENTEEPPEENTEVPPAEITEGSTTETTEASLAETDEKTEEKADKGKVVYTGDNSSIGLLCVTLVTSGLLLVLVVLFWRKHKKR